MARRKVMLPTLALPLERPSQAVDGTAALASLAASPTTTAIIGACSLPPLTKAQVHYWRELCGVLAQAGPAGLPSADDFPPELRPTPVTLKAMTERGLVSRRQRAWHLTRHWYTRLTVLRQAAVDTPQLRVTERPSPGLPSYAELKDWEALCRWLDTQPRQRARLPFATFPAFVAADAEAQLALGDAAEVPSGILRAMRKARLVRHTGTCEWVLARAWRARLVALWHGLDQAQREVPGQAATPVVARSLVAGIDTWILNWQVEESLPARLRRDLDAYQEQAREAEAEVETRWRYDGVPLQMYRWGTRAESGGGVSWSYVLVNPSVRLVIRKSPLGGIIAQARLGSACLWRLSPRRALDELDALVRRMWGKAKGHWQVSQVHLAHDLANAPIHEEWRDRFVSRSRSRAVFAAAQSEIAALLRVVQGHGAEDDDEELLAFGIDWDEPFAMDDALYGLDPFAPPHEEDQEETDPLEEEVTDRAVTVHGWGRRLSGMTFSPGGAISVVLYRKDWEQRRRGKAFMQPLWEAVGWQSEEPVTRCEVRLRREALRTLRLPEVLERRVLDDPWQLLEHVPALFATVVGQPEEACPDAVNVAWLRLVVPDETVANHARWKTDPVWRIVQSPTFSTAPAPARRLIRRREHTRCAEQLDGILYGLLARRVAELHPEGEAWDISRALGDVAPALEDLSAQPEKDFGQRVRTRRQELGLSVAPAGKVLPLRASQPPLDSPAGLAALDAEPPVTEQERARWRVRLAERRMREAYLALEEAEQRGISRKELERLAEAFTQASEVYGAAVGVCDPHLGPTGDAPHDA
jgi:hypothetical protein